MNILTQTRLQLLALILACLSALPSAWSQTGYFVQFPPDVVLNICDPDDFPGGMPEPVVYDPSGTALISQSFSDEIYNGYPDACVRVERRWTIIDWNTYNSSNPCIEVPNPRPNPLLFHVANLPGPIVSAPGTPSPWTSTIVKINPDDPAPTDYSTFWVPNPNCYEYLQIIWLKGDVICPKDTVVTLPPFICTAEDFTYNVVVNEDLPGWELTQTGGLPSGADFPIGTTVNSFQVTDANSNAYTCSFTVTVVDAVAPTVVCAENVVVNLGPDSPNDCYEGGVKWVPVSAFDQGSFDNCGAIKLTVRRIGPYSDCINSLNIVNGQPNCNDVFPDFPSEFEKAITEQDSIKFYCCEAGSEQVVALRAYQLTDEGELLIVNGVPVFNDCLVLVEVKISPCNDGAEVLTGQVSIDANDDCIPDAAPTGLPGTVVVAIDSNNDTLYSAGSAQGVYSFLDPAAGLSSLTVVPPSPLWTICNNPTTVNVPDPAGTIVQNFTAQATENCPILNVKLATNLVRPCTTSNWLVSYCNLGGASAPNAYVKVISTPDLLPLGATKPFTINGDTITVQVGELAIGECGTFTLQMQPGCSPDVIGRRACVEALIYPGVNCLPPSANWSGAQIVARGECTGDSIRFTIRNTGTAPTASALDYVIIDDMVIMRTGQIPAGLQPDAELTETLASDGEAFRLNAQQEPGHPLALAPSVSVENCNGAIATSLLLEFQNEDGDPFSDYECREIVGSFDPNEKLAFPRGFSDEHYIEPGTLLSYQINFQNTGNDTAFLVVLRDTLSHLLDPATLRMGPGSHPYTWSLEGEGLLTVRFENILLPDSTTNEPASHGFVQFEINHKADIPLGSVIENRAGIYFDINPVVLTNTVWHTVDVDFLETVGTSEPHSDYLRLNIWPNPSTDRAFISLDQAARVRLLDAYGHPIRNYTAQAPGLQIERSGLPGGIYLIEARMANGELRYGKLMLH
ncbi:MAG: HYR domain-containing protein [Saprospiraceae bacterium]|nr:HYR domain-containing protein [Saprospiraceae bacterium]